MSNRSTTPSSRRRQANPLRMNRHENVFLDSQILNLIADRSDPDMNVLSASEEIQLVMPYSVAREVDMPSTPDHVKKAAAELLRSVQVGLNMEEQADIAAFTGALIGKKRPENIVPDLKPAWEARKYGGRFLISIDHDLLSRSIAIRDWNGLHVLRPAEARVLHDAMVAHDR